MNDLPNRTCWTYSQSKRFIFNELPVLYTLLYFSPFRFTNAQTIHVIIKGFMGTAEEALKYIERGYYIGLTGYLCKVSDRIF